MRPDAFRPAEFPRSANYDPDWVLDNMMGPNALWLTESLAESMEFNPDMRVLDLGCGRALSSIFLAKEFDVQVWATDLWIDASENYRRICAAGVEDRVFPIGAEAHALPFAEGFFDAMVSMDAYHYFGTDDLYLESHLAGLVRTGGQLGIVVPGLVEELTSAGPPEHLQRYWEPAFFSFHSPTWWKRHWENSGMVTVELADLAPDGWKHWMQSDLIWSERLNKPTDEADMLAADAGRTLGLVRMVARRNEQPPARLDELEQGMNQPAHPLGEIVRHGNGTTSLRFERLLARPPERVWRALTDSDQLRHWMPCDIVGPREAEAEVVAPFWDDIVAKYGIEDTVLAGRIVTWRPPSTFAWEWDDELLTYDLEPTPTGTQLKLSIDLGTKSPEVHLVAAGYHICLDQLCALVDTGEAPPFIDADPSQYEALYAQLAG